MWADVNTKTVQGQLFRTFQHHMMGVPVDYDDEVERKRTHPMLLPKIESERMTVSNEEMLKSIEVLTPTPRKEKQSPRIPKGIIRGKDSKSTLSRSKLRRSERVLDGTQTWRGFPTPVEMEEWGIPLSPRCQSSSLEASRISRSETIVPYERRYVCVRSYGELGE